MLSEKVEREKNLLDNIVQLNPFPSSVLTDIMNTFNHFDTFTKIKTVLIALCAVLSIAQMAVQDASLKGLRSESDRGWWFQTYPRSPIYVLEYVPAHIDWAANNLLIAASAFCFVAALIAFCKVVHDHGSQTEYAKENDPKEPASTKASPEGLHGLLTWELVQLFVTVLAAVIILVAFIHTFIQLYRGSTWYYSDSISSESWFALESWVCQSQDVVPDGPWLHKQCRMAVSLL